MCTSREEFGTLKIHSEVEEVVAKFLNKEVAYFRLSLLVFFLFPSLPVIVLIFDPSLFFISLGCNSSYYGLRHQRHDHSSPLDPRNFNYIG